MKPSSVTFELLLSDFDLSRLPVDEAVLRSDSTMLASAVQAHYEDCFRELGGSTAIAISNGKVSVTWFPGGEEPLDAVLNHAVHLLNQGDFQASEPLLRSVLSRDPRNGTALYNLGMMLSDRGRLDEAIESLEELVELGTAGANAWTALGVAYQRKGQTASAIETLEKAVALDPSNPYAIRNLAALVAAKSPEEALGLFTNAVELLPSDAHSHLGMGQCLLILSRNEEADAALKRVIDIDPYGELAERAKTLRTKLSETFMRERSGDSTSPGGVLACLEALRVFEQCDERKIQTITFEVAMLGRGGLDINDPAAKYGLKSLPGDFTGMQLVSLMYVGLQRLAPGQDAGIDLSKEYKEAQRLAHESQS